jgi:exosortase A-associated hydrolase 2
VHAPAFAEEMNKSRRMVSLQARALASAGFAVIVVDLMGCGDSDGDFEAATWSAWNDDLLRAADWLQERHRVPLWFWGLRVGALLACSAAAQRKDAANLLLWQPSPGGRQAFNQFLRLKAAADLQGGAKVALQAARQDLEGGRPVDIAGYRLGPVLAREFESATLDLSSGIRRVEWLEVSNRPGATLLPASASTVQSWSTQVPVVRTHVATGPAFWQTTEIEDAPALLTATLAAVEDVVP